jgi:hypothetical protein
MAQPDDDRSPDPTPAPANPDGSSDQHQGLNNPLVKRLRNPYGQFTGDGNYWFEWTPFTPAINAWRKAGWYLWRAHAHLDNANKISGFAIPGLETDYAEFNEELKIVTDDLNSRVVESKKVVEALEVASRDYAKANVASYGEYMRLQKIIMDGLTAQKRPLAGLEGPSLFPD